ncbi:hypothetical protein ACJW31_09G164800 [Castanea mollissima]
MTKNDDDNDNSADAILVNVLLKLEQLIPEPFKVQIFWTQNQKHYSKATTVVLNLMYTQERGKRLKKMEILTCQSLSVILQICAYSIHTRFINIHFLEFTCHYHLWTKLVARFSIIDRQH